MLGILVVFALMMSAVVAFAPAKCATARYLASPVQMGFEAEIGAQPPLGFWDPLGLLADADQQRFDRLRYVETKHGRISMLAILGHLVTTAGVRLPGEIAFGVPFANVPTGLKAFDVIPAAGTAQLIAGIGLIELGFNARQDEIEEAQFKASGWDVQTFERKQAIEVSKWCFMRL